MPSPRTTGSLSDASISTTSGNASSRNNHLGWCNVYGNLTWNLGSDERRSVLQLIYAVRFLLLPIRELSGFREERIAEVLLATPALDRPTKM